jgi:sn-glycerol 3-phosphate transport system permease protein
MSRIADSESGLNGWLFIAPAMTLLLAFVVMPAFFSLYLSFHDFKPFSFNLVSVGLDQYRELAESTDYRASLAATLKFVALTVPASVAGSLALALLLDSSPYFRSFLRTIFLLPVGISPAMAAMLWIFLFNPTVGFINYAFSLVGLIGPAWLTDPSWAPVAVSIATVWKEIGFNIIFLLAALAQVPVELKEAAWMDGANASRRFVHVTLPAIIPALFFVIVVTAIHAFESFGQIHILTRGGPAGSTSVLVYQLFRDGFENSRLGLASAEAVMLFLIIGGVTVIQFLAGHRMEKRMGVG